MMRALFTLAILVYSFATLASDKIKLLGENLSASEKAHAEELILKVESHLPEKILKALISKPVKIFFHESSKITTWGQYTEILSLIQINRKILSEDQTLQTILDELKSQDKITKHKSLEEFRIATLIHEIGHHYDEMNIGAMAFQDLFPECPQNLYGKEESPVPLICGIKDSVTTTVSTRPWFLEASGFVFNGILFNTRIHPKGPNQRAVDVYERKNAKEFFAVNLEFFLLDEEFQCRKPFLYEVYAKHFETSPFSNSKCSPEKRVYIYDMLGMDSKEAVFDLNPERIYELHYLFAGEGKKAMSRFGHAMLRLVICKPGRERGPDCVKDIAYHKVISFRALIGDDNISTWKGLTGGYNSSMPIYTLTQIIQEYTELELRNIYSFPLKIEREKIDLLTKLISERFWSYAGDYKFLSNNCADETANFLKALLYDRPETWDLLINRPDHLAVALEKKNILDRTPFQDRELATKTGYFFKTKQEMYDRHLKILKDAKLIDETLTLDQYLDLGVEQRKLITETITQSAETTVPVIASAMQFERIIFLRKSFEVQGKIKKILIQKMAKVSNKSEKKDSIADELTSRILAPGYLLAKNDYAYGVPSSEELSLMLKKFEPKKVEKTEEEIKAEREKAHKDSMDLLPKETQELDASEKFLNNLKEKYNKIKNIKK
ncbi:MAG: DUF4105 domain-containing protein [Bacteriovoracaceae bacterium]